jgi:hypothetical protein
MRRPACLLAGLAAIAIPALAQQAAFPPGTEPTGGSRNIVPWRHFGPRTGDPSQNSRPAPEPAVNTISLGFNSASAQPGDPGAAPDAVASANDVLTAVSNLSADYQKREQERQERLREFEAATHNDPGNPTSQALADIESTRLLLEGEQDRMQSSEQLSQAFTALAARLETHSNQIRDLLKARRETAQKSDAEFARVSGEAQEMSLALKNLAMLPAGSENDQFIERLASRLDHLDQALKTDQEQSQQAHRQLEDLQAVERELHQASDQAIAKAAELTTTSQQAKVNQDLLANRLEFSSARQRASDELSSASQALTASNALHGEPAVEQAVLGGVQDPPAAAAATAEGGSVDALRACIRRTGDVAACRASGGEQK